MAATPHPTPIPILAPVESPLLVDWPVVAAALAVAVASDIDRSDVEIVDADVADVKVSDVDVADTKSVDCQRIETPFP